MNITESPRVRGLRPGAPRLARLLLSAVLAAPCARAAAPLNALGAEERAAGWRLLFDGRSLDGWRVYAKEGSSPAPIGEGWRVEEGVLRKLAGVRGGDIVTEATFDNFELRWEWRIEPGGNSGVKYLVTERRPRAPGHEYQMVDDESVGRIHGLAKDKTASFYQVVAPAPDKPYRPAGQWNESAIVVRGRRVEHWLNGARVLEYELGSPALQAAVAESKFKKQPGFGEKIRGRIMLTDHRDAAWFRNVKVRELAAEP